MTNTARRIVVGVDGSALSLAALAWAEGLTAPGDELHVVTAGPSSSAGDSSTSSPAAAPGAHDETHHHRADRPAAALLTEIASTVEADLVVIGAHGGLPGAPRILGSVTHQMLRTSPCPIAVVPRSPAATTSAPVVVGIGDGPATRASIDWAAEFATSEGRPVVLVRAVNVRPIFGVDHAVEVMASYIDSDLLTQWANAEVDLVAEELATAGIETEGVVRVGRAGRVLVEASDGARVVVVGKHLDGPVTGYFAGVTLHHVLTHATCPVIVVAATHTDA